MRSHTFELLSSIAALKKGRRYLLRKTDIVVILVSCLVETQAESAAVSKAVMHSEVMEH